MRSKKGFTLIELMIAVAVIAIIAAIAIPSYANYVRKSKRADAHTALLRIQLEQEKWRANNASYGTLVNIGVSENSPEGYYTLTITNTSATGYTATANAKAGTSQANDTGCTGIVLTLNASGETRTPATCW
ncbi:type IV pilin protein [Thiorhodospira sibirica]|uniref:type IV pilin protein n=1 Tax=Thiorhodospira sibirica TaxID=154347 RepID=UPI00022C5DD4|nr:type IV pilin protein [Thiorhodospira sibirica]